MFSTLTQLITKAQEYMRDSIDPMHDLGHVERVVENSRKISADMKCSTRESQILELAAWWHDVGRAVIKKPSLWMIFFDDIISAFALFFYAIKFRNLNRTTLNAIRLVMCHSYGIGTILGKVLLGRRNRILLNILTDSDNLDLLNIGRIEFMRFFSMLSTRNEYLFRSLIWISLNTKIIYTKTKEAQKYLKEMIRRLIEWVREEEMYLWHVKYFGEAWMKKTIHDLEKLFTDISTLHHAI
ncbi:MAG: HD domain-containing protein [Candidatus Magasanikbacteria bacterium]|nr:HD domain-containing protein [Candidatus Magasanikbacteria bacterium]